QHHRSTERAVQAAPMGASSRLRILVDPVSPRAGQPVRLLISAAPAGASDFRWDVTSPGAYTVDSGAAPATTAAFPTAGPHPVAVEVQTPAGVEHAHVMVDVTADASATISPAATTGTATTTSSA